MEQRIFLPDFFYIDLNRLDGAGIQEYFALCARYIATQRDEFITNKNGDAGAKMVLAEAQQKKAQAVAEAHTHRENWGNLINMAEAGGWQNEAVLAAQILKSSARSYLVSYQMDPRTITLDTLWSMSAVGFMDVGGVMINTEGPICTFALPSMKPIVDGGILGWFARFHEDETPSQIAGLYTFEREHERRFLFKTHSTTSREPIIGCTDALLMQSMQVAASR